MKFKLLIFLRNFGVLAIIITTVCITLSFFTIYLNQKKTLKKVENGLSFVVNVLKQPVVRNDKQSIHFFLKELNILFPETAYVYIDFNSDGKELLYSVSEKNYIPYLGKEFRPLDTIPGFSQKLILNKQKEFKSPQGIVFHDISIHISEKLGILHIGLSQLAINRDVLLQIRLIILLCFIILCVGGGIIYGIAKITDRESRQVEKALQESEEKYRTLANQVPVGIYRTLENGRILYANPALANMLGYESVDELININVQNTLAQPSKRDNYLKEWKRSKGILIVENNLITKDGSEIWVRDSGKAVTNKKGEILYFDGIIEDITDNKLAEEIRGKLEDQLRQAQKMEAIGNLAGGIAHDFNNILSVIIGYSEMTLENIPQKTFNRTNIEKVLVACNRAKEMVDHILAFSRKSSTERKPILLSEIVKESLKLLRSALPSTIDIRYKFQETTNRVMANWTEIHQVIINLCTNAAYAMREKGGILEITIKEIYFDPQYMDLKELEPGKYQLLTLSDTGSGMDVETVRRIFEPYYTTKPQGEGTGMGLSVAHGIIKNHSGEITVYTEPGRGTTFHIYLPITQFEEITEEISETEIPGGVEHILFVDDEETIVELTVMVLESLGYLVDACTSSFEALDIFKRNPHGFDLVITDQTMPKMTGIKLSGKLRQIRPDIPIILCTGFSESVTEEAIKAHKLNAFVMKPLLKREIAMIIRNVLDNQLGN